jgi:hypothetical protein
MTPVTLFRVSIVVALSTSAICTNSIMAELVSSISVRSPDSTLAAFDVPPGVVLSGAGVVNGSADSDTAWVVDGAIQGISLEEPIVLTGFVKGIGSFDNVVFDGTFAPGHSPALVTVGSTVYTASNVLEMEIGGSSPGSQHDKIVHTGVSVLGGTLNVVLINAFAPQLGNTFDLFDWNGGISGTFSTINLPALGSGLSWDASDLYFGGQLAVSHMPEGSGFLMTGLCLGVLTVAIALNRARRLIRQARPASAID